MASSSPPPPPRAAARSELSTASEEAACDAWKRMRHDEMRRIRTEEELRAAVIIRAL